MAKAEDGRTPRVIGAGWGRTGTASLKLALEQLGFGPCHHMEEVIKNPPDVPTWVAAARGEKIDWKTFLRGWGATSDFPSALFYRELAETFPDAKVVLTVRDSDSWYESMRTTIVDSLRRFPNRFIVKYLPYIGAPARVMGESSLKAKVMDRFDDKPAIVAQFEAHNEEVKRVVAAERLLVFDVKQGWSPLCSFLGVPVPEADFPRVNDAKQFQSYTKRATIVSWVLLLVPILGLAALLRWLL
jgi:hypothetical protein